MEKLTDQQIEQTYEQLGKLHVTLENVPEKGLSYVKERLALCRAMQDQVQNLRLQTGQALSYVQTERIYVKHSIPLAQTDQEKEQLKIKLREREQDCVSHGMLHRLVNATASVLAQTSRDIKLLGDVMIKQIKLGEMTDVNPADSQDVGREATLEDMAAASPQVASSVVSFEAATAPPSPMAGVYDPVLQMATGSPFASSGSAAEQDLSTLFSGRTTTGAASEMPDVVGPVGMGVSGGLPDRVSFEAPAPQVEAERVQLADRRAVPIEALFAELAGAAEAPAL